MSLVSWFKGHLPTRETIAANRWLKPFSKHLLKPDLWRLNRRSVPRAVAIGLFIAPVIPVAHTAVAAMMAVPARANIVIAASVTWLINPFTMPFFYWAAFKLGSALLKLDTTQQAVSHKATDWLSWLYAISGPAALGTFVLATIIASLGYLLSSFAWKLWIGHNWKARGRARLSRVP
ncbi:MAG: hypothetical protein RIS52_2559 [Pseudomonadota bacterium]|jgi:uncharacterized protein (DUF2062 family)